MIPKEILKKVKLIEIQTKKMVNNIFSGEYHTHFKGQGMTFSDFREYVPGDDVRSISWPLTARTGKTFVKTFEEERELSVILAVDISASTDFGSGKYVKGEVIVYLLILDRANMLKVKSSFTCRRCLLTLPKRTKTKWV